MPDRSAISGQAHLLLLLCGLLLLRRRFSVFAAEPLDAAGGIDQLLLAGKEGVAVRADFYVDVAPVRGTGSKCVAARAMHAHLMVCRMNRCLHWISRFLVELFDSKGSPEDSANRHTAIEAVFRAALRWCCTVTTIIGLSIMGFYARYVLPKLIDLAMRNKEMACQRAEWIPHARGDVLEIGIGSGLNLPFYSNEVRRIVGVDPSLELQALARRRLTGGPTNLEFVSQSAELRLPLADGSMDSVVVTWSLCSIENPAKALSEMRRVLKPTGNLIFIEHGRAPESRVAVWQERLTPLWKRVAGGCHLNRKVDHLISGAGFQISELRTFYMKGPRPMTYTYQGIAQLR
jgi:ubiquinone/menaquinone biosynthesis C-methylase UbiE